MDLGRRILLRMFGRPHGVLGRLGGIIMARVNRAAATQMIGLIDLRSGERVLEIGFGPGVAVALAAEQTQGGVVAGIDASPAMVAQAQSRNADAIRAGKVDLRLGTAERLPFADGAFDKAFAINSMQVWPDVGAGLREIHRVLRHGAFLALAFTVNSGQQRAGVTASLAAAGFQDARIVEGEKLFCAIATKP